MSSDATWFLADGGVAAQKQRDWEDQNRPNAASSSYKSRWVITDESETSCQPSARAEEEEHKCWKKLFLLVLHLITHRL